MGHALGAKLLVVLLNAATGVITARALHPAGRGELAAVLLWPMVLSGALTLGLPSALTFQLRRCPENHKALVTTAVLLALGIGLLGSGAAVWLAPRLLANYSPAIVATARWLMPNLIVGLLLLIGRATLEAGRDFARSGFVLILPPLLTLCGLLALVGLHRLTPGLAGATYTLAGLPAFAFMMRHLPVSARISGSDLRVSSRRLLSYGVRSYGIDLCGTVSFYVDQAFVVGLLSPADMGIYAVSLSLSRVINVPHQALAAVLFPSLINLEKKNAAEILNRALRIGGTLTFVAALVALVAAHTLLRALYGRVFAEDALLLPLLTLEAGLSGCVLILAQAFMAFDRPGVITVQQGLGLLATVPMLLWLVPRLGIRGAALSILLSTSLRLLFICFSYAREFGFLPSFLLDASSILWLRQRWLGQPDMSPAVLASPGGAE